MIHPEMTEPEELKSKNRNNLRGELATDDSDSRQLHRRSTSRLKL